MNGLPRGMPASAEQASTSAPAGSVVLGPLGGGRASSGGSSVAPPQHSPVTLWLVVICFAITAVSTYKVLSGGALERFVLAVDRDPYGFLGLFVAFYTLAVVLFFPTMLLQVLSGALYNFYVGLLVSWFATTVGQSLAFLLARYLLRRSVKAYLLERVPNFPLIEAAVKKEGWKIMCMLRLSPILPYNVLNYAAALTPIPFLSYALSSAVAILPWTCLYVYLGTFTTNVADLLRGKVPVHRAHSGVDMVSSALYMVLLTITIVYGYVLSRRAINSALKSAADDGPNPSALEEA